MMKKKVLVSYISDFGASFIGVVCLILGYLRDDSLLVSIG